MPSTPETYFQFENLLVKLARAGVDYAVVGGVAVSLNGFVRATDDVDILVHELAANTGRMIETLKSWGEGWARELKTEDFIPQEGSIRLSEDFDLDIFTRMRGKALDDFRPSMRYLEVQGVRIPYLAPESLIFLKGGSWREKDQLDVIALKEILSRDSSR